MVEKKIIDFITNSNDTNLVKKVKVELRDSVLTYMQTTGFVVCDEIQELLDISNKTVVGCIKFYKMYIEKKE